METKTIRAWWVWFTLCGCSAADTDRNALPWKCPTHGAARFQSEPEQIDILSSIPLGLLAEDELRELAPLPVEEGSQ